MNHPNSTIVTAAIVNRLELWFEQGAPIPTDYVDVNYIYAATSGLWGYVFTPMQISQALQKIGSPKLHTNEDGSKIRRGTFEEVIKYQIEYYFGDKNYHKDSFLQTFKTDMNPEAYVPTVDLLRFAKMKRITSSVPKNVDLVQLIATVLVDSDIVAVHPDRAHLRKLSIEESITKKVEHFFKLAYFPRDSFLSISTLATLPKLQKYDYEFLERVIQNTSSNVFELSSDKTALRKKTSYKGALMLYPERATAVDCMVEPVPVQVTKYVEYLFGDVNFPKDNHMQSLAKQHADGFIPLHEIMKFPRMRKLCTDYASVSKWLQYSDVVMWSDDRNFLKRRKPLPEFRKMVFANPKGESTDEPSNMFTVMTYNILADFLTTKFQFPYTTPETRNWENRKKEILKEILFHQPDVVCLQEIQTALRNPEDPESEHDHLSFFADNLRGYEYIYKRKTRYKSPQTIGPDIGNAIFYNASKFALLSRHDIEFEKILWKESKKDMAARGLIAYGHPQVAILGYFTHIPSGKPVFIATTHICSDYQIPYIQMRQVRACLNELQRINKQKAPIVLAGDFNAQPESPVYHFLATGHIPKSLQQAAQPPLKQAPKTFEFHHEVGLASAYAKVLGREPQCTNVTHEFEGTLDYLWYSKKALRPVAILDIPSLSCLKEETGLPSKKFPSDHLPLLCKFRFHTSPPPIN